MNIYLSLDKHEHLPIGLTWHFLTCKKCRTKIALLSKAEKASSEEYIEQALYTNQNIFAIMSKIDSEYLEKEKNPMPHVSMAKWIISGAIILITMIALGILVEPASRKGTYALITTIYAVVLTFYCAFFVACNLDFFIKHLETHLP